MKGGPVEQDGIGATQPARTAGQGKRLHAAENFRCVIQEDLVDDTAFQRGPVDLAAGFDHQRQVAALAEQGNDVAQIDAAAGAIEHAHFDAAGFEAVVYGYYGRGLGTTGLYILATSDTGQLRDSDGGYVQLTYKIDRLKIGASYGISQLKLASDEEAGTFDPLTGMSTSTLVHKNESEVFGLYYSLTKSLTLVGEYSNTEAKAWNDNEAKEKDVIVGGMLFF